MKRLLMMLVFVGCSEITAPSDTELSLTSCPPDTATTGSITLIVCLDGVCPELPPVDSSLIVGDC
jgi:hypothetical protein